ncbi:MAG: ATP synthase subunit I [Thermodesulfovibrionales bacterium]|nr:ATP synthase subunit I [Thermodesulfovibrionales bacterium]
MEHSELMIKRIYRQSAFAVGALAIISLFFTDWRFSLGIVIGGLAGEVNLRGIVWSVRSLLGTEKAQIKMMVLSMFRLFAIFFVLAALAVFKMINVYGLLVGFTVVFIIMIKEGIIVAKRRS